MQNSDKSHLQTYDSPSPSAVHFDLIQADSFSRYSTNSIVRLLSNLSGIHPSVLFTSTLTLLTARTIRSARFVIDIHNKIQGRVVHEMALFIYWCDDCRNKHIAFFNRLDAYMQVGRKIILSEYPFSNKQKKKLVNLCDKYEYIPITIRLVADFEVLWERRSLRDSQSDRHLSHLMSHYHFGDTLSNREFADNHITKERFKDIIEKRKYNDFQLGELFEYDVSDFSKVSYSDLLMYLSQLTF